MQPWALLQFALILAVVIGSIALIISELRMVERAEDQEFWRQLRAKVAAIQ